MSRFGLGFQAHGDKAYANDAFTTLLYHMDGPVGATLILDSSPKQNGYAANNGSAHLIGNPGSGLLNPVMYFDGGAYMHSAVNVENSFNLYANDFTIDWWEHKLETATARPTWTWDTTNLIYAPMLIWYDGVNQNMWFYASNDGANWNLASAIYMGPIEINVWVHRAIVRKDNNLLMFHQGVLQSTTPIGGNGVWSNATYGPCLGLWPRSDGYFWYYGYIDEFRVSNGIARWTENFQRPSVAYTPDPDLTTRLLMHFNSSFDDSSQYHRGAATPTGSVGIVPGYGKFSTDEDAAGFSGGYINYPDSQDWVIGTQDFTMDAWVYLSDYPAVNNYCIMSQMTSAGAYSDRHLFAYIGTNGAVVSDAFAGSAQIYMTATAAAIIPLYTWTHVAVVRNGRPVQIYINGVLQSGYLLPDGTSFQDLTGPLTIGAMFSDQIFRGYIDEARLVIGMAVWTENFTPPTQPYNTPIDKTVLLLNFDGDFTDKSQKRHGKGYGPATISTAQSKFGGRSAAFAGSPAQYTYFSDSPDFAFGDRDFTIDFWFYYTGSTPNAALFGQLNPDLTNFAIGSHLSTNNTIYATVSKNGNDWGAQRIDSTTSVTSNVWHHYALVRSGDVIKLYLDGVQEGPSLAFTGPVFDSTNIFVIGALGTYSLYWTGYMDEWRITKGKALWTANFTPPTMAAT